MKIEKFNDSSKKIKLAFVIGFILCAIIMIVINLLTSKAKYQNTQSINIATGKVSYTLADLNMVAMYKINDDESEEKIDAVPGDGYILNEESKCTIKGANGEEEKDSKITIEYINNEIKIEHMTKKGTKCYIYFEEKKYSGQELLEDVIKKSQGSKTTFTSTATTDEGIWSAPDGMYGGTSYYYRGAVTDNYVSFAGFMWRIIRINGDGTLRLIYDGKQAYDNGVSNTDRQIGTKEFNSSYTDNKFVGFKYGDSNVHGTTTASTILGSDSDATSLYGWYKTNIKDKGFDSKVDQNGLFCGDRNATQNSSQTWDDWLKSKRDSGGTGSTTTYYGAYMRFVSKNSVTPTLNCENANDIFSKTGSTKGNKSLTYPVGLITADEVVFAGGWYGTGNSSYYLYTGNYFWTMSPYYFNSFNGSYAYVFIVYGNGNLSSHNVGYTWGVRPVLNLKADTVFKSGNGSYSTPYEVG